ncbi:tyrosine-type recombinase/integrase [Rhodococcus sp. UNC363MFTsu5.1]|uniref:tyrosine-type recombinase/integrase n=1 Tax=Rhodococcus sp. UNC363MFTsu5.1 TaxID=1449069 RepID=UPI00055E1391|nr:site-specific integrase [Rhodococcus sp. UNC363MFTsu5.1]
MTNSHAQRRNRRAGVEDRWWKTVRDANGAEQSIHAAGWATDDKGKDIPPARKRWRARYVDDTGREHSKAFDKKVDAQAWLDSVTVTLVQGTHVAPSAGKGTVGEAGERWLKSNAHLKATTTATREVTWAVHVKPKWGSAAVRDVRTTEVRAWVAEMVAAGTGVATIENALGAMRQALDIAVEDRQIAVNPCLGVKAPRRQHKDRGYLTHAQVAQLALEVDIRPEVIRFLALTGLRWGEMAALRVSDFDMLRRRVTISRAVAEVKGKLVWSTPKTHERRSVPFPRILVDELSALMRGKGRDALVFASAEGEALRVSTYRPRVFAPAVKRLQKAAEDARDEEKAQTGEAVTPEFPTVTPHDLRHTAASLAISAGANVKAVQKMLGHAKASMTLDVYADLFEDDLEAVAEALDVAARAAR